jgi:peptidoglycan/xylan/chitin deacetylase (PgdA/CDA1 family)
MKIDFIRPKTPWIAKKAFPSYVWDIPSKEKVIYLTFDDGPTPNITEKVLEILANYNAEATFFCIGKNIVENPAIYQQVLDNGHAVGNHTYNHLKGWKSDNATYIDNVEKTQCILNSISPNLYSKLFRPPYGRLKPSQGKALQKLDYKIIMWDVLAIDWDSSISKEEVLDNIISNTVDGSIVVLHDSQKASVHMLYALPRALAYFSKKGFCFKKIEF